MIPYISNLFAIMEIRCYIITNCMHYVRYILWPVGYRKLCMSCFTMTGFVLHILAMPCITDNGMSINKQTHNIQQARDDLVIHQTYPIQKE